jgi:predicted DNA-binding antitoxin AbrB/MazE fold protein
VKAIRAHIQNGIIVPDAPIELPEGAAVEVLLPENDELNARDRDELEVEVEASRAEFERGELVDAHAFALGLVAKS